MRRKRGQARSIDFSFFTCNPVPIMVIIIKGILMSDAILKKYFKVE
jgi:hypothetical protein